jgi:predicted dehydrogenase
VFTVVGAGFGIYGYLPALIESFGEPVILPRDYERVVMARPELEGYRAQIRWVADIDTALRQAKGAVIAVRPAGQPEVAMRCCAIPGIERLVLEKPLAPDPAQASALLRELASSGKRYRIGYSFLATPWRRELAWPAEGEGPVCIDWTFMAHHFANGVQTWKRVHSQGGGVLRFYGIQLLALLAHLGYRDVAVSNLAGVEPEEPSAWSARFSAAGLPQCHVHLDSRSQTPAFAIAHGDRALLSLRDPFDLPATIAAEGGDRRIPILGNLLSTFAVADADYHALYERTNALWKAVEDASRFTPGIAA